MTTGNLSLPDWLADAETDRKRLIRILDGPHAAEESIAQAPPQDPPSGDG